MASQSDDREVLPQNFKSDTVLQGVETDARAHGGGDGSALEVSALCSGGLSLCNGAHDGIQVGVQLLCTEGSLAHGDMDDVLLVQTVLDLTSLGLRNCLAVYIQQALEKFLILFFFKTNKNFVFRFKYRSFNKHSISRK